MSMFRAEIGRSYVSHTGKGTNQMGREIKSRGKGTGYRVNGTGEEIQLVCVTERHIQTDHHFVHGNPSPWKKTTSPNE